MRKNVLLLLLGGIAALLTGCTSIETAADFDRNTDFSKYRTYGWIPNAERMENAIAEKRLTAAIENQLASKGLAKSEHPDLWVSMHARLTREVHFDTTVWGYGPGRWHAGVTQTTRDEIPVGTLVVDLVDAGTKELVWRGTARSVLDLMASPEEKERRTNEVVAKMFANFPPKK